MAQEYLLTSRFTESNETKLEHVLRKVCTSLDCCYWPVAVVGVFVYCAPLECTVRSRTSLSSQSATVTDHAA